MTGNDDVDMAGWGIIVGGSSSGIGRAIAESLLRVGAQVTISGRDEDRLSAAAASLADGVAGRVVSVASDLSTSTGAARLVDGHMAAFGRLDVLVLNTGGPPRPIAEFVSTRRDSWSEAFATQLLSAVNLARHGLPHLRSSRMASIIAVTSATATQPMPHHVQSTVYRSAVASMCRALTRELGPAGIRVNMVAPASIATERLRSVVSVRERAGQVPLRRLGTPEEAAAVVRFLASPAASYLTGVTVEVDGGYLTETRLEQAGRPRGIQGH